MQQNMITIRNLSKEFKGQNVLKNITMSQKQAFLKLQIK